MFGGLEGIRRGSTHISLDKFDLPRINAIHGLRQPFHAALAASLTLLCLAGAAQAQTVSNTVAYGPPPTAGTPEALLDTLERRLVRASGRIVTLRLSGNALTGIFYAPLGIFWQLDKTSGTVRGAALMTRTRDQLYLDRDGRILLATPDIRVRDDDAYHPLARFHDRLLTRPLARPIADLPAGSRFERYAGQAGGGVVRLPQAWTPVAVPASPLWRSLGDHIAVTRDDGSTALLHWRDLETALHLRKDEG